MLPARVPGRLHRGPAGDWKCLCEAKVRVYLLLGGPTGATLCPSWFRVLGIAAPALRQHLFGVGPRLFRDRYPTQHACRFLHALGAAQHADGRGRRCHRTAGGSLTQTGQGRSLDLLPGVTSPGRCLRRYPSRSRYRSAAGSPTSESMPSSSMVFSTSSRAACSLPKKSVQMVKLPSLG